MATFVHVLYGLILFRFPFSFEKKNQPAHLLFFPCLHPSPSRLCLSLLSQLVINGFNLQRKDPNVRGGVASTPSVCLCARRGLKKRPPVDPCVTKRQ